MDTLLDGSVDYIWYCYAIGLFIPFGSGIPSGCWPAVSIVEIYVSTGGEDNMDILFCTSFSTSLECSEPMIITSNLGNSPSSILSEDCETQWTAPEGKTGAEAELVIDLHCMVTVDLVRMKNGGEETGIKEFSLFGTKTLGGAWERFLRAEMRKLVEKVYKKI